MRVLHLTNMYPNEKNWRSGIFVKKQIDSLRNKGLDQELVCLGAGFGGYRKIFSLQEKVKWAELIHAHFGHVGSLALFWKFIKGKPLVVSYCGSDILGTLNHREKALAWINTYLSKFIDYAIVRSAQLSVKVKAKKINVIPCGIDVKLFHETEQIKARKSIGLEDYGGKLILFLGQKNNPVKNFPLFQKALSLLDFEFRHLLLEDIVYDRVYDYMNAADVCVLTSHYEGSPNVIKEAMCCNRPIVSVDVGDVRGVLDGAGGCFVVDPDPVRIAGAINKAIGYKRTAARQRVFQLGLDLDTVAEKIIGVYREVCH